MSKRTNVAKDKRQQMGIFRWDKRASLSKDEWYARKRDQGTISLRASFLPDESLEKVSGNAERLFGCFSAEQNREKRGQECPRYTSLFFLFFHLAALGLCLLDNLVLELLRDGVVVVHFHREAASALRHGG